MSYSHYILKIDSRDSINYGVTTNPLQISLNNHSSSKIERIILKNASIPNVFYNINMYNNKLMVGSTLITFPIGHYNINDLITYFNTNVVGCVLSFNTFLNKYVFTSSSNLLFVANQSTILYVLGLNDNVDYTLSIGVQTASFMPDLSGVRNIHVETSFSQMNVLDSKGFYKSYIANIAVDVSYLNIIHYINQQLELDEVIRSKTYSQNLNTLTITLRDNKGNLLDLQNQHYELNFKVSYGNDDTLYE